MSNEDASLFDALVDARRDYGAELTHDALMLRMYGEHPPGYENVTWQDWERRAEAFLRSRP